MENEGWLRAVLVSVFGAIGIGLGVSVIGLVVGLVVTSGSCTGDDECVAPLAGMFYGILAGAVVAVGAVGVLAARRRLGPIFCVGAAGSFLLLATAYWQIWFGSHQVLLVVAMLLLVGSAALSRHYVPPGRWHWRRPRPAAVILALGLVVLAAVPMGIKLVEVSQEQRKIEAVIQRPLQTDLRHTSPYGVKYASTGITYTVLQPYEMGQHLPDVYVTLRTLDIEPCHGFGDVTEAPLKRCTEVEPRIWQSREPDGRAHFFVRGPDRQWAYVVSGNRGGDVQRQHDARALQVARSLEPRSAWPLAADAAECGFCGWFS